MTMTSTTLPISISEKSLQQKDEAKKIIKRHTLYAAGLGFIPIPIVDAVSITAIQIWMIRDIAKVYGIPFKRHIVKSFIGSIVGNTGAIGIVKFIPGVGSMLGGTTVSIGAATATYALGQLFMEHFYQGGTLLDFDPVKSRSYFQKLYSEHEATVETLQAEKDGQPAISSDSNALGEMEAYLKERELYFQEQQQKNAQTIADLQQAKEALLAEGAEGETYQQETDKHIAQLEANKTQLETTIEELQNQLQAQEDWADKENDYLDSQETDRQEIMDLLAASKSREEEIVALQQQLKAQTRLAENNLLQYKESQEQLEQSFAELGQEVEEKEALQREIVQHQTLQQQQKQQVQTLETENQQKQQAITILQRQLQETEASQKRNWLWWILLPLLLLLVGWFAGLSYGKKTSQNNTPQEQSQPLGFKSTKEESSATDQVAENVPMPTLALSTAPPSVESEATTTPIEINPPTPIETSALRRPDAAALGFDPNSAEAAMANHLSNPTSLYPKTFWTRKIYFLPNAVEPHPSGKQQIENIALIAQKYPQATIRIYGHTDQAEGWSAGINRANLIAAILMEKGIASNRMLTYLIDKESNPEGIRGIEFELLNG